jgi:galactokinase
MITPFLAPELDTAVDAALAAGALGSRMVGGGFGGSAIALIQASKTTETIKAIEKAFSQKGFKAPRFFTSCQVKAQSYFSTLITKG